MRNLLIKLLDRIILNKLMLMEARFVKVQRDYDYNSDEYNEAYENVQESRAVRDLLILIRDSYIWRIK